MADKNDKSKKVKRAKMAVKIKGSPAQVIKGLMKLVRPDEQSPNAVR